MEASSQLPTVKRLKPPPTPPGTIRPAAPGGAAASAGPFFAGLKVYVPSTGIPFGATKAKLWRASVQRQGGSLTQEAEQAHDATHVVVGDGGLASLPPHLQPGTTTKPGSLSEGNQQAAAETSSKRKVPGGSCASGPGSGSSESRQRVWVGYQWVEQSLAKGHLLPPEDFPPPAPEADVATPTGQGRPGSRTGEGCGRRSRSSHQGSALGDSEGQQMRRWLGPELWHPGCDGMGLNELVLQAVYDEERSRTIGNEPLVQALRELCRYERALHEDYFNDAGSPAGLAVNHRALRYSRAASVVRASAYRLRPGLRAGELPFVGQATAQQISDILETGTCQALDCFRVDAAVTDSKGRRRADSEGGATRARFHALPGVGQVAAKRWWDLGCRSYEAVLEAAQPGGPLGPGGPWALPQEQRFSLEHHEQLLEGTAVEEVEEMQAAITGGLEETSGHGGWQVELVGGGRRSAAAHDADFLVTHPSRAIKGAVLRLRDHLVAAGRLVPPSEGMCRVQAGLLPTHLDRLREEHLKEASAGPSIQTMDKFDHLYGLYFTKAGRVRRMDVIIAPPDEFAFGLVGWIGSRQYLRFMRQHAKDCGMFLNSHRLMRKVDGRSLIVPEECPPVDRSGQERWPPGWQPGRQVDTEQDLFELLGIPYRPPHQRNAP